MTQNFNHEFNTKFKERANLDEEEKMRLQEEMEAKLKAIDPFPRRLSTPRSFQFSVLLAV